MLELEPAAWVRNNLKMLYKLTVRVIEHLNSTLSDLESQVSVVRPMVCIALAPALGMTPTFTTVSGALLAAVAGWMYVAFSFLTEHPN